MYSVCMPLPRDLAEQVSDALDHIDALKDCSADTDRLHRTRRLVLHDLVTLMDFRVERAGGEGSREERLNISDAAYEALYGSTFDSVVLIQLHQTLQIYGATRTGSSS